MVLDLSQCTITLLAFTLEKPFSNLGGWGRLICIWVRVGSLGFYYDSFEFLFYRLLLLNPPPKCYFFLVLITRGKVYTVFSSIFILRYLLTEAADPPKGCKIDI